MERWMSGGAATSPGDRRHAEGLTVVVAPFELLSRFLHPGLDRDRHVLGDLPRGIFTACEPVDRRAESGERGVLDVEAAVVLAARGDAGVVDGVEVCWRRR